MTLTAIHITYLAAAGLRVTGKIGSTKNPGEGMSDMIHTLIASCMLTIPTDSQSSTAF
jgi:hypothetical protein